jgi:uncharacterized NAD(P)/FAD-binding protein YdhS
MMWEPKSMKNRICIIGSGPTGMYTLLHLAKAPTPLAITIFEAEAEAGKGTPYLPGVNDPAMLSNIPSIEIPMLDQTLMSWMREQSDEYLSNFGIIREAIHERQFYPRLVLGDYFHDQFLKLVMFAKQQGHAVDAFSHHRVIDIAVRPDDILVTVQSDHEFSAAFEDVVLATGHQWPNQTQINPGYFPSAWPAAQLQTIKGGRLGILGTSLSAIDALMTVATSCGSFVYDEASDLKYQAANECDDFHAVMMSRKGLLPEADFYCPLPYLTPAICTPEAVAQLIEAGPNGLLDGVFALFKAELAHADGAYAAEIGLSNLTVETFAQAYYLRRANVDPFVWAAENLQEAEQNFRSRYTVPWRYAIMITHEIIATIVPHLHVEDFARFNRSFKSIFIDEYATVPHLSIKRLIALHQAGRLDIHKLGDDYEIITDGVKRGARVEANSKTNAFDNFINATGQKPLSASNLPFPTLITQKAVRDAATPEATPIFREHDLTSAERLSGIDIDEAYRIKSEGQVTQSIYCAAIPFLLHKNPFIQGITSAAEIGETVANAIIQEMNISARTLLTA